MSAGGVLGAMPSGGGTSQTAVNRLAGARSQVAAMVTAAAALATLLLLGPVIALMPQAALAAVVVFYSLELIKPAEFKAIRRVRRIEFRWAVSAFAGVVLLGTLQGILVAVIASLVSLAHQAYNPPVHVLGRKRGTTAFRARTTEHPDDETWPGLLILRPEGRLFFANAERVVDRISPLVSREHPRVVLLDCRGVTDVEYTALAHVDRGRGAAAGRRASACGSPGSTRRCSTWCAAARSAIGSAGTRMFFNLDAAVHAYEQRARRMTGTGRCCSPGDER